MLDVVAIVSIITSITSLIVAILTHISSSKCFGIEVVTKDSDVKTPLMSEKEEYSEKKNNET